VTVTALLTAAPAFAQLNKDDIEQLREAAATVGEIRNVPDNGIPDAIWRKAECVVVIPSLKKAGFIVGAEGGEGVLSCRQGAARGAPVFMELTKGSVGLQAEVTLGKDASIAAGPVGRTASAATDAQTTAAAAAGKPRHRDTESWCLFSRTASRRVTAPMRARLRKSIARSAAARSRSTPHAAVSLR
jgi:lipid-binding SYLF domain-containing protein